MLFKGLHCICSERLYSHAFTSALRRLEGEEGEKVIGFVRHFSLTPLPLWGISGEVSWTRPCEWAFLFWGGCALAHLSRLICSHPAGLGHVTMTTQMPGVSVWFSSKASRMCSHNAATVSLAGTDRTISSHVGRAHGTSVPLRTFSWQLAQRNFP